jgi:hypothetical protein
MMTRKEYDAVQSVPWKTDTARQLWQMMYDLPLYTVEIGEPFDNPLLERSREAWLQGEPLGKPFKPHFTRDKIDNADLGWILESGKVSTKKNTRFLMESMDAASGAIVTDAEQKLLDMLKLNGSYKPQTKSALKSIGNIVQEYILGTIATRPLIDTGQLLASITFKVRPYKGPYEFIDPLTRKL